MTANIKTIYKLDGDSNEYDSEQEAQIAECIEAAEGIYVDARNKLKIAKAISERYFLVPIVKIKTVQAAVGYTDLDEDDIPF